MFKKLIVWVLTGMLGLGVADSAFAFFHQFRVNEVYSNADGTIQFIELYNPTINSAEYFSNGTQLIVTPAGGGANNTFTFPSNLPVANTAFRYVLLATQGFANLGIVTPDFIIPDGFLFLNGGTINLGNFEFPNPTYPALPTDGTNSLTRTPSTTTIGTVGVNSPTNYAGATGSVSPPADTTPDAFSFTPVTGAALSAVVESNAVTVAGINAAAAISITGGEYSVNSGAYTASAGTVVNGNSVKVRVTASASPSTTTSATLTIGGVSATFNVTTLAPDTQAPTVPGSFTATAVSSSQINLGWAASSDVVGVTAYHVFREGVQIATLSSATLGYNDTGLAASTLYNFGVRACDAAGNCSAQAAASATTLAGGTANFNPLLLRGWNLMGNSLEVTLNVVTLFGSPSAPVTDVTTHVNSIWKWSATLGIWQFYAPSLTAAENQTFADTNGFEVLASIEPGLGYWVNLKNAAPVGGVTLPAQTGAPVIYEAPDPIGGTPAKIAGRNLVNGWQLVAIADPLTPSQFNENLGTTPPDPYVVKLSFESLWAWDAALGQWYFYAPQLHKDGVNQDLGLALVKQYADANGFLHFEDYDKKLGVGTGFWMRK